MRDLTPELPRILTLFVLAIATSLDSLGVGVAYGLNGTRVRFAAHVCISVVMMAITWTSVAVGDNIARFIPESAAHILSAVLFGGIGLWILRPVFKKRRHASQDVSPPSPRNLPSLTEVLDNPLLADQDGSRDIDLREALLLGAALSLNNIGGGVSAGLIHLSPFSMASLSVFFNVVCICGGYFVGARLSATRVSGYAQALSGVLLILVGLWQLK